MLAHTSHARSRKGKNAITTRKMGSGGMYEGKVVYKTSMTPGSLVLGIDRPFMPL